MGTQLPLPATWARLATQRPHAAPSEGDRLADLRADAREAKAKIRLVLDGLAERHAIAADAAMGIGHLARVRPLDGDGDDQEKWRQQN